MSLLETVTELFDLFGETGTCVICQEDLVDGERVRAIRKCQHLFHQACIEPWIQQKSECPMCRTPLNTGIPYTLQQLQASVQQLQDTLQTQMQLRDRYILSYCLTDGILRKFRCAARYNEAKSQIIHQVSTFTHNGLRPVQIDFNTRASLLRANQSFRAELTTRLQLGRQYLRSNINVYLTRRDISQVEALRDICSF
jgi:hypothetical protein